MTNLIYPGGRAVAYAYDGLNRLSNVTDWSNRRTSLEYDLASRVRKVTRPNGTVREIGYDAAGQTTNIVERTAAGEIINLFKFQWNSAARMDWEFAAPLPHAFTPPTRTMTFDDDNRLATFNSQTVVHDLDGNMTVGPLTNNVLASYTYDARNRLLSTINSQPSTNAYGYDPSGNRTAITNGANVTKLVVNPNAALSQVLIRTRPGVTNYYFYGAGLLYEVTETASSTNTLTYHFDYRGSTVALTDGNGSVTDRVEYSPYATITFRSGTNDTPFLFNGRYGVQTDANGLLHMRARYYNPFLCRFVNADPSGFGGGLNHYAYADGNPVSMIDPFGLDGNPVSGLGGTWPSSGYAPGGAYFVPHTPTEPANYSAPNPTGNGVILFDSGVTAYAIGGGGAGTQTILLANGQIVSYGYVGAGIGFGGRGGNFGLGEVIGVYKPTDYEGKFLSISAGYGVGGVGIATSPIPGDIGSASYSAGAGTAGISASLQWYWIIDATDPVQPPDLLQSTHQSSSTGK